MLLVDDLGALRGVRLDLARAPGFGGSDEAAADAAPNTPAPAPHAAGRPIHVLVAEDEIEAATEIAEFLGDLGYAVEVVGSAPDGIDALDRAPRDVLVTDLSMPGGGARTLVRAAEAAHPDLAVIIVSGLAVESDPAQADLVEMADAILRKPIGLGELRAAIERVLGA
nr:response regulator [Roseospira navarrensis]